MKALIQRTQFASCVVDGKITGEIKKGLLVFLGVGENDTDSDCEKLADKISRLRIFSDENDKTNLSINDVDADMLIISQFTLYADCSHGNRPSFTAAGKPDEARRLYELFSQLCSEKINGRVENGIFGADMKISLLNDGPFTIFIECKNGEILK